ncbi:hypothetical protein SAMN06265348_12617 [Pedobacter westerhofensis]|uniref:Uncharacterized protein n=1 Tax=Pedobacter westerhofensis TaxID=425512 RepID=A0A521FUB9_9SPHI|nr:hypothetical protein [Pedobacter westerhofensis]SMO99767.1 hypothetical protein SAMN06265348_12617 [Pedobacter westerhofensis]
MINNKLLKWLHIVTIVVMVAILVYMIINMFFAGFMVDSSLIPESLTLIIALISLILSYFTFMVLMENKRPQVTINLDWNSRYNIVQLEINNVGQKAAKDITIKYSTDSIWNTLDSGSLSKIASNISSLNSSQIIKKNLGTQNSININSMINLTVRYKNLSGLLYYEEDFVLNFNDYKNSASYENELTRTLYELQALPNAIIGLNKKKM